MAVSEKWSVVDICKCKNQTPITPYVKDLRRKSGRADRKTYSILSPFADALSRKASHKNRKTSELDTWTSGENTSVD